MAGHVEPCPRRIRGVLDGQVVVDTLDAAYVWDRPEYPRYAFPVADVTLEGMPREQLDGFGTMVAVPWDAVDAWFEEEERIHVHPRNPYARVDALRSGRHVRIERDGVLLAETERPVVVFETGLPPRTYVERGAVRWERLVASDTRTECPYKGVTSEYWSLRHGARTIPDIAWSYAFPTTALAPIAGLVCFFDERVDVWVDGVAQPRPKTGM